MKQTFMVFLIASFTMIFTFTDVQAQSDPAQAPATPPGLYTTVSQSEIYIIQGNEQIDLKVGEAAFAGLDSMQQLDSVPEFLNWPCGGTGGQNSDLVPGYSLASLPAGNRLEEVVRLFFEGPEIPLSTPAWLNGESHGRFSIDEINSFPSGSYWYETGKTTGKMEKLRPKILLVSLYPATQQVIVDQNHYQELRDLYGAEGIPVTFVFNEGNVIPVSRLGKNATIQGVADLYFEKGITIAEVPIWYAGDRHLTASPAELEHLFDIPALEDIDPDRLAALIEDLQNNGFSKKPISVSLASQNNSMVIDEGEKIRAAQSIGIESIPIVFFSFSENSHRKHCGLTLAQVAAGGGAGEGSVGPPGFPPDSGIPPNVPLLPPEKPASRN